MRLSKGKQQTKTMPENTIPLINIVFLMLIFFLIAGTVAPPVSTELKPPESEDLPSMPPAGNAVEILKDGSLIHRGEKLDLEQILARFPAPSQEEAVEEKSEDPVDAPVLMTASMSALPDLDQSNPSFEPVAENVVNILADRALTSGQLMPVLQAFRAAGHKKIRLVTVRGGK